MSRPTVSPRVRGVLAGLLAVLACALLLVSILAIWAGRTVLDTDRVTAAVDASLADPVVLDALSGWVESQTTVVIEESRVVERLVPPEWTIASSLVERAIIRLATDRTDRLVRSEEVHDLVVAGTRRAHSAVLSVLDGDPPSGSLVVVADGRVDLNLLPVVVLSIQSVQRVGLLADVDLPELTREMTVEEQNAALGEALGVDLRDDLGQLTIYERDVGADGSVVRTAQRALQLFRGSVVVLAAATVVLAGLALALAPNRLRIAAWFAGGALVVAVLAHEIVAAVVEAVPEVVADPEARAAARVVIGNVVGHLDRTAAALAVLALVALLAVVAWGWTADRPQQRQRAIGAIAQHPDATRAVGIALALVAILVGGRSIWTIALAVAIAVAGWLAPAALRAQGRPNDPEHLGRDGADA